LEGPPQGVSPLLAGQKGETLKYWGGQVQTAPQLYLLFWGNNFFNETPPVALYTQLREVYYGLGGELDDPGENSWQGILTQYTNAQGPYTFAKVVGESKLTAIFSPKNVTEAMVLEQINAWTENGAKQSANTQMIVLTPPGTTFSKEFKVYCGFHGIDHQGYSYSLVVYQEEDCTEKGVSSIHETTDAASHEFAESVTDPGLNGETAWEGAQKNGEVEIADLCNTGAKELPEKNGRIGFWFVTELFADEKTKRAEGECTLEDPPYPPPAAPSATTGAASSIETTKATLEGSVNPNGPDAHYYFEYGTTTSYGTKIPTPPGNNAGFGETAVPASVKITSLKAGTLYHYRLVASSWVGTTDGVDQTFRTAGWTIQSTQNPHGSEESDEFTGVSCWSATGCDAVGSNSTAENEIIGLVERWNGTVWEVQSTPKSTGAKEDNLESVSCRSASECEATGYAEVAEEKHITLAERWNGTAWSVQSTPTTKGENSNLVGVSCASASECVASGFSQPSSGIYAPLAELWNGREWKILTTATLPKEDEQPRFESISCPSAKDCIAVGGFFSTSMGSVPLVESYNGSTWTLQSTPSPEGSIGAGLTGVSCSATSACTAMGGYYIVAENAERALIERYNGTSWQLQESPSPVGKPAPKGSHWALSAVSCPTASSCVAVGSYDESASGKKLLLGEEWNGSRWELALPVDRTTGVLYDEARGVSCSAALTCTLAGLSRKENNHNLTETLAERMWEP
jgi:hypothetical protein